MRPSSALATYRDHILKTARHYGLENPRVFGSTARGSDNDKSDLDILVTAPTGTTLFDLGGFLEELQAIIPVPIHVTTEGSLPPNLRQNILTEAKPV